ncbi:cobyrinic acid a,c-diamide synthase, partial [Streptomyces goshikiensis]
AELRHDPHRTTRPRLAAVGAVATAALTASLVSARPAGAAPRAPPARAPARSRRGHPAAPPARPRPAPPRPGAAGPPPRAIAPARACAARGRGRPPGGRPVVAVAGGAAFTFSYAEHAELLTAAGAEVVTFDPLRDEALPAGTSGLVIGGGFPEVYAPELSANEPLRRAVADFAAAGGPVAAECAGLLYLARSLDGKPMCGVLDADARMSERLTLGYREAVAVSDSALAATGTRLRGHEFHRTVIEPGSGAAPAWGFTRPERRVEGFVQQGVHASYLHTHWAAEPSVALRFTGAATAVAEAAVVAGHP